MPARPFTPPRLIGHRGAKALAPENTLGSIRAAKAAGAAWVEIDAKLAGDGVPVLMHDASLDRTTDVQGPVVARGSAELATVDAGNGEGVPTLAQCLALCREIGLGLDLEIKPDAGTGSATARAVLAVLAAEGWGPEDPIVITSFSRNALRVVRDAAPDYIRGLLLTGRPADWREAARDLAVDAVIPGTRDVLGPEDVTAIVAGGWLPMVYTVNDPQRARELYDWGMVSIVTDDPPALLGL
ncbi:glycerophosphodiester phosphodiesterase family protein [Thalassobaculum salexigens]|uniref:glycerophosphodiester phosphodiesterase family protein n=1 Tax=Thalassobaculum salexigens TaxID=455360 RepID=UPI00040AD339|nr:glycerophosphodiester phosphodiesterase family protein [Thalassobaculum salexigens]